jgi:hypothetical protein
VKNLRARQRGRFLGQTVDWYGSYGCFCRREMRETFHGRCLLFVSSFVDISLMLLLWVTQEVTRFFRQLQEKALLRFGTRSWMWWPKLTW